MQPEVMYIGQVAWPYSRGELWVDGAVHVLGFVLAVAGSIILLAFMVHSASAAVVTATSIYLATLLFSITASAAYNIWPISRTKWLLRRVDHSAIYLLIAGTYTPFMVEMGTWTMLVAVWTIAFLGVGLKLVRPGRFDRLAIGLYLALGWSGVATYESLVATLSPTVISLIVAGGMVYSLGVIFHVWETLRYQNAIWHGFVLVAAAIHYAAVWCSTFRTVA